MKKILIALSAIATFTAQALEETSLNYAVENGDIGVLVTYDELVSDPVDVSLSQNGYTLLKRKEITTNGVAFFNIKESFPQINLNDHVVIEVTTKDNQVKSVITLSKTDLKNFGAKEPKKINNNNKVYDEKNDSKHNQRDQEQEDNRNRNRKHPESISPEGTQVQEINPRTNKEMSPEERKNSMKLMRNFSKQLSRYEGNEDELINTLQEIKSLRLSERYCFKFEKQINRDLEREERRGKHTFEFLEEFKDFACKN